MERTQIEYVKTDDGRIRITCFSNVASCEEIEQEFGSEVGRVYHGGRPEYRRNSTDHITVYPTLPHPSYTLGVGFLLSREDFERVISAMKAAGRRLQRIKESVAKLESEVKTITI